MRALLFIVLLLGPLTVYWAYLSFVSRRKTETGGTWNEMPVVTLLLVGFALMISALVYTAVAGRSDPGAAYQPSRVEDGVLIPGRAIPDKTGSEDPVDQTD